MIRKLVATSALTLGALALIGPITPASAGGVASEYADCVVTVDPASFQAGDTVTVRGTGLEPNFTTTIEFNSVAVQVGTALTDSLGAFTAQVKIPAGAVGGGHTITAVCDTAANVSATGVTVLGTTVTTGGGKPLARTGTSSTEPLVAAGGIALLVGTAFVLVARRRRNAHAGV